jgi:hypothetical protein
MGREKGGWRYQAVYIERDIGEDKKAKEYSICEIYLDKDGKLEMWTENPSIAPYGLSYAELAGGLRLMLEDIAIWEAVAFDSLCAGMTFEKRMGKRKMIRELTEKDFERGVRNPHFDKLKESTYIKIKVKSCILQLFTFNMQSVQSYQARSRLDFAVNSSASWKVCEKSIIRFAESGKAVTLIPSITSLPLSRELCSRKPIYSTDAPYASARFPNS